MDYTLVSTAASDDQGRPKSPGAINGGLTKRQSPIETPVITIRVEDIDAIGKTIEKNGGKVIRSKETIGDGSIGFAAYFRDTEGNVVGLFQSARR
jgi:predicted enzyme related to lactoylglutathione lyase